MSKPEQVFANVGGRRFTLTVTAALAYTIMFVLGILTESGYITLQLVTVGAYLGANAHQKYLECQNVETPDRR